MWLKLIGICFLLSTCVSAQRYKSLNQMLAWKTLEYGFPSDNERQYALDNQLYIENTGTPIDVGVEYKAHGTTRIFTTIPRFSIGIPFTLATVSSKIGPKGPVINAYPNYDTHKAHNADCKGITSAFRLVIDECNHMWVIDSGMIAGTQICPPQLLTFDLNTDTLIHRFQFTTDLYVPTASLFITPAVDIYDPPPSGRCQKAMVYITDVSNHGLVVYDSQRNTAWRIENKLMFPDPDWGTHTIAGESFDLMDGMFAVNLTPRHKRGITTNLLVDPRILNRSPLPSSGGANSGERYLYFHALASDAENSVPLRLINNQTIWENNHSAMPNAFRVIGRRGVQAEMEAMDSKGNLFANTHDPITLFAWNINTPYAPNSFKIVANNPEQLQFASGMKVVKHPRGHEELWISTCRFQKIGAGTQNVNEINFRILACKIDDLLSNKGCSSLETQSPPSSNSLYNNLILH